VTNRDSIYARLTDDIVDNVRTAHLRSSAPTTFRRDNVNIVNNVRVSKTSLSPLTWLALQIGNEPSTTDGGAAWAELPPLEPL
jgi:hypothetical protein